MKLIQGDEHFGGIGFGGAAQSGNDTFTAVNADRIMEPTVLIDRVDSRDVLKFNIEDIICWDVRYYDVRHSGDPDNVGAEDVRQSISGGITKDQSRAATDIPTADTFAEGTFQGGRFAGAATQGGTAAGEETPRYENRWQFFNFANEENAVGEINIPSKNTIIHPYSPYELDGNWFHHVLTARHYHLWSNSSNTGSAGQLRVSADVRKISVELEEVLFDRSSIISIEDAIGIISS